MRLQVGNAIVRRVLAAAVGAGLLGAGCAAGYWYALDSTAARYETAFVTATDIVRTVSRPGQAVAARESVVRSAAGGTVREVLVSAGDPVQEGQILARLSNPAAEIAAEQARVSLDLARLSLDDLFEQAGAMQVTAPVAGRLSSLNLRAGDSATRGAPAAVIEDPSLLVVDISVPEHIAPALYPCLPVRVNIPAIAGAMATGYVVEVGGSLQGPAGSATVPIRVGFCNPGPVLPGMTASVVFSAEGVRLPVSGRVGSGSDEVLTAPDKATVSRVLVVPGQEVTAGQLLAELANPGLVTRRDQARLAYQTAKDYFDPIATCYNAYDSYHVAIRVQYEQTKQTYNDLEAAVARLRVTSPCTGVVTSVGVRAGDSIEAGAAIVQVVPAGSVLVKALVPGSRLYGLAIGQNLPVSIPDCGLTSLTGTLTGISPQTASLAAEGRFEVTVEVTGEALGRTPPLPGTAAQVVLPEGQETVEASGSVAPKDQVSVRFGASGTVGLVMAAEGDLVSAGDVLYVLVNAALLAGEASAGAGSGPGAKATQLTREELASRAGAGLREAILRTRSAELAYEQRLNEASGLTLRADHAGMVADVKVKPGDVVAPGGQVASVYDTSAIDVITDISELDVGSLQPGTEVEVFFPAIARMGYTAKVTEIGYAPSRGQEETTYPLRLRLDKPTGVLAGMSCTVSIATDVREDVAAVPVEAIQQRYGVSAVRVVRDERREAASAVTAIQKADRTYKGEVEWVYVVTGITDGIYVEIVRGLPLSTEIVVREIDRGRCPACNQPLNR